MRLPLLADSFLGQEEMPYLAVAKVFDSRSQPYPDIPVEASFVHKGAVGKLEARKTDGRGTVIFPLQWKTVVRVSPVPPEGYVSNPEYRDVETISRGNYDPDEIPQGNSLYILEGSRFPWATVGIVAGVIFLGYLVFRNK